jgi:hypothetical protein
MPRYPRSDPTPIGPTAMPKRANNNNNNSELAWLLADLPAAPGSGFAPLRLLSSASRTGPAARSRTLHPLPRQLDPIRQ